MIWLNYNWVLHILLLLRYLLNNSFAFIFDIDYNVGSGVRLIQQKLIFGKVLKCIDDIWFRKDHIFIAKPIIEYNLIYLSLFRWFDHFCFEGTIFLLELSRNAQVVYFCMYLFEKYVAKLRQWLYI